jgi:WXG100 family type VII secretion target
VGVGALAEQLKVDPIDLHMSSDHMDVHHVELRAAHAGADSDVESAQRGWVGASATALQSRLAEWQAVTTELCDGIEAHGNAFRAAANAYTDNDGQAAESIHRTS